jgi:hypothetical protein
MAESAPLLSGDVRAAAFHGTLPCGAPTTNLGHNPGGLNYVLQNRDFAQPSPMELGGRANTFGTDPAPAIPASLSDSRQRL